MSLPVDARAASVPPVGRRRRRHRVLAAAGVVLLVGAGLVGWQAWSGSRDSSAVAASAVQVRLDLQAVDVTSAQRRIDQLAGVGRLNALARSVGGSPRELVGQLTFSTRPNIRGEGQLTLFVIDNRYGRPLPWLFGVGPAGSGISSGWDGRYNTIATEYPWLHAVASIPTPGGGSADPGTAISIPTTMPTPITFVGKDYPDALPITNPSTQLTFALAFTGDGDDGPVHWVKRLTPR